MSDPPPKKVGSLRDRIAAFEKALLNAPFCKCGVLMRSRALTTGVAAISSACVFSLIVTGSLLYSRGLQKGMVILPTFKSASGGFCGSRCFRGCLDHAWRRVYTMDFPAPLCEDLVNL